MEHRNIHDIVASAWSSTSHANASANLAQKLHKTRLLSRYGVKHNLECQKIKTTFPSSLHFLEVLNRLDILLESRSLSFDESSLKVSSLSMRLIESPTVKKLCGGKGHVPFGLSKETTTPSFFTVSPTLRIATISSNHFTTGMIF